MMEGVQQGPVLVETLFRWVRCFKPISTWYWIQRIVAP